MVNLTQFALSGRLSAVFFMIENGSLPLHSSSFAFSFDKRNIKDVCISNANLGAILTKIEESVVMKTCQICME